jgi:hypothetical protein
MAEAKKQTTEKKKGGALGWLSFVFGLAVAAAFFGATMAVIVAGMLPTIVALITDRSPQKHQAIAISVLNFAGVLPFIMDLWSGGRGMAGAMAILMEPTAWFAMYGAAGIGWAIYTYVPKVIGLYTTQRAEAGIATRRALQKRLVARWGEKVTSTKHISTLEEH